MARFGAASARNNPNSKSALLCMAIAGIHSNVRQALNYLSRRLEARLLY
jgi:hypothetical protein